MGIHAFFVPAAITGTGGVLCAFFRQRMERTLDTLTATSLREKVAEMQRSLQSATARIELLMATQAEKPLEKEEIGNILECMDSVQASIGQLRDDVSEMSPGRQPANDVV